MNLRKLKNFESLDEVQPRELINIARLHEEPDHINKNVTETMRYVTCARKEFLTPGPMYFH